MTPEHQWFAFRVVAILGLLGEFSWAVLSLSYEEGSFGFAFWASLIGVAYFVCYVRKIAWAYKYSPYYGFGTGSVMAAFYGESTSHYGAYAYPMLVVEGAVVLSSFGLILVYFLPAVREQFGHKKKSNITMESDA
ncbi:MAG: hypothetical protein KDA57_23180 [Planctomycetales bacterium]|nr:hypothetical protein [Planctomycetales bacterium]